ncbi:MAG: hypothetical protein AB1796_02310 [Bacillota bacterium]
MQFQGKKIGIATTVAQLVNTIVLKEMEQMITGGAELFIIILDADERGLKNPLKELLPQLRASTPYSPRSGGLAGSSPTHCPPLDLLVIISGFPGLLEHLVRLLPEEYPGTPLVLLLLPSPGEKPAFPQLSSLIEKKGVFFVPFGSLSSNRDKESGLPLLCSRIDLLGEACAAALEGCQLRPFVWDNHYFPH